MWFGRGNEVVRTPPPLMGESNRIILRVKKTIKKKSPIKNSFLYLINTYI